MDTSENGLRGGGGTASIFWFGRSLVSAAVFFGVLLWSKRLTLQRLSFLFQCLGATVWCIRWDADEGGVYAGLP